MASVLQNFREIWQRMSLIQRLLLVGIVLACVGASALLVGYARKPDMALLYANLASEEAGRIVEKVRESGTPFEIRSEGTAIYVPSDKVHSLRLSLAGQGLPKGDQAGYSILDEEKIGISPFTQRINAVRAAEGELAKTIGVLDGVTSARVHIVKPEEALFGDRGKDASATVVLRLRPGWRLSPSNVAAIVHIMSGSVPGLSPQKVVVVDAQGRLLSGQGNDEMAGKAGSVLEYKTKVEEYFSRKAEDLLAAALGPGRASVKVDAIIDTTSLESEITKFDKEGRLALKEDSRSSTTTAPSGGAGGGNTKDETTEYAIPKTIERKIELPGTVKSVSVAAFVDLSAPSLLNSGTTGAAAAQAGAKLAKTDVEEIIRSALGIKAGEGSIKVVDTPFYKPALASGENPQEEQTQSSRQFYLEIARNSSLGVLVVGALLTMRLLRGPRRKATQTPGAAALPGGQGLALAGGSAGALPGSDMDLDPEMLRTRISRALQENPEEVKRLFTNWAESEKGGF